MSALDRLMTDPNPIWMREMRQSSRFVRTPWVILTLTLALSLIIGSVGGLISTSDQSPSKVGGILFQVYFSIAFQIVTIVGPLLAASSIASEREGRTWEAVILTGLSPTEITWGKFLSAYSNLALYLFALAPVGAMPFVFGGVTITEVTVAFAFLFSFAALMVAFGLAVSSMMASNRSAIVITLLLAVSVGPMLYISSGFGLAAMLNEMIGPEIPAYTPVWLPIAIARASFGVDYVFFLVLLPMLALGLPAWFFFEVTIANLTDVADDHSSRLKRWYLVTTVALIGVFVAVMFRTQDPELRRILSVATVLAFAGHLIFTSLLFASEPPGVSRRVRTRWMHKRASVLERALGPGQGRTYSLALVTGAFGLALITLIATSHRMDLLIKKDALDTIVLVVAFGLTSIWILLTGVVTWVRSFGHSPWATRIIACVVILLLCVVPVVIEAIMGGLTQRSLERSSFVSAAVNPFYFIAMIEILETGVFRSNPLFVTGAIAGIVRIIMGLVLVLASWRKCAGKMRTYEASIASVEATIRAEDAAGA